MGVFGFSDHSIKEKGQNRENETSLIFSSRATIC